MNGIVNSAYYANGRRVASVEVDSIKDALKDNSQFVWIGMYEPDEALLATVQREFSLHDLAIEDAHRAHQRPKVELYGNTLFVVVRTVHLEQGSHKHHWGETHFFVGSNFLISIRHGESSSYSEVRTRCENAPEQLALGPGFVLYALIDSVVDCYLPVVDSLEHRLEELESCIFEGKAGRETTSQLYELKREVIEMRRALLPLVEVCSRLTRYDIPLIPEATRPYFRDVADHATRLNEMVDSIRELISTAIDANLSHITISQNEVTKRFAGWAAIIAVPTMVAGIYGMNFRFMPELEWQYGYPLVLILTFALCSYLYRLFKRAGWF